MREKTHPLIVSYNEDRNYWWCRLRGGIIRRSSKRELETLILDTPEEKRHAFAEPIYCLVYDPAENLFGERVQIGDFELYTDKLLTIVVKNPMSNGWISPEGWRCYEDTPHNVRLFDTIRRKREEIDALKTDVDRLQACVGKLTVIQKGEHTKSGDFQWSGIAPWLAKYFVVSE